MEPLCGIKTDTPRHMNKLQEIWKDPVWSKVIAAGLIFIFSQIPIVISSIIKNLSISQTYDKILIFLTSDCIIPCWILILIIIAAIISIIFGIKRLWDKNDSDKVENMIVDKPVEPDKKAQSDDIDLTINEAPTVFFHDRFCEAFPGYVNGYRWFTKSKDINNRLSILLKHPTRFKKADGHGITSDPIWWFRGSRAFPVYSFKILNCSKVLMNCDELKIEKIAAYRGLTYFRDFIYVQCYPDKPIGIYKQDKDYFNKCVKEYREFIENHGIYKGKIISSQELSDGAAIIRGKPQSTTGAESRYRFLTKYNFIIAAKFSPYNCNEFYRESDIYFINLLKEKISFDDFVNWMSRFEKNINDY